jgi:cytochrome c oxidase subunit 3
MTAGRTPAHKRVETQGVIRRGTVMDVAALPSYAFGHRAVMWWGTFGVIAIEATVFALTIFAYLYLRTLSDAWPMGVPPPELLWGTATTLIMLASVAPNHWMKHAAEDHHLQRTCLGLLVGAAFSVLLLVVRLLEFGALNVSWDTNAYGSIVWLLLGLHTLHLITELVDTGVLSAVMVSGRVEGKRYVDAEETAIYWDFVVLAWMPIYAVIYWVPRF